MNRGEVYTKGTAVPRTANLDEASDTLRWEVTDWEWRNDSLTKRKLEWQRGWR